MSKAKNRKRAKLLTKRKRERERLKNNPSQLDKDDESMRERFDKDAFVIDREKLGLKEKIRPAVKFVLTLSP